MAAHVFPYTTPISRAVEFDRGYAWGTGNYVSDGQTTWLVTNEHVAAPANDEEVLAHLPVTDDDYVRIVSRFITRPWPEDLAISKLDGPGMPRADRVLSVSRMDSSYAPDTHELLFWLGYPGSTAGRAEEVSQANIRYSWFGSLETLAVPIVSQEITPWPSGLPNGWRPDQHVVVHYGPVGLRDNDEPPAEPPNPKGMSGSLLWDTKRVACLRAGKEWAPEEARVCGVILAAHLDPAAVLATRVQALRDLLIR